MIRTLFVEDEYFVRQGFVHSIPWENYGIAIVGEADNGAAALDYLGAHEVDLLITDLTMPIKSGLDLLQETKALYPELPAVVLTCHRDFDFIQEALRLGAIDYIVKTRLDTPEIERSLQRIKERLNERQAAARQSRAAILLVPVSAGAEPEWPDRLRGASGCDIAHMGGAARLVLGLPGDAFSGRPVSEALAAGWGAVRIADYNDDGSRETERLLTEFADRSFPYVWQGTADITNVSLADLRCRQKARDGRAEAEIVKGWRSYNWVLDQSEWNNWIEVVRENEPPLEELGLLLGPSLRDWMLCEGLRHAGMADSGAVSLTWKGWIERLGRARDCLVRRYAAVNFSRDVYLSALKSLDVIRLNMKDGARQGTVAHEVGLSRSYFSGVFKDSFGVSFNDYARACSVDHACALLAGTDFPIYRVAELSGFRDERYFSRVFRDSIGLLPSEYRAERRNGPAPGTE